MPERSRESEIFADIFVTTTPAVRNKVACIMGGLVRIYPQYNSVEFTDACDGLPQIQLVILGLLAQWVKHDVGLSQTYYLKPLELSKMTRVRGDSVRPVLMKLKKARLIRHSGDGYGIYIHRLDSLSDMVAGKTRLSDYT